MGGLGKGECGRESPLTAQAASGILFGGQTFTVSARAKPDWRAERTGRVLRPGEEFKISQRIVVQPTEHASGQSFYRLADGSGWVFRYTLTGEEIVEEVTPPIVPYPSLHSRGGDSGGGGSGAGSAGGAAWALGSRLLGGLSRGF